MRGKILLLSPEAEKINAAEMPKLWLSIQSPSVFLLSRVRLFVTPWTVAYKVPLSMGFPRQEYWSGLPFPSPGDLPDPGIEAGSPALQAEALPSKPSGELCGESTMRKTQTHISAPPPASSVALLRLHDHSEPASFLSSTPGRSSDTALNLTQPMVPWSWHSDEKEQTATGASHAPVRAVKKTRWGCSVVLTSGEQGGSSGRGLSSCASWTTLLSPWVNSGAVVGSSPGEGQPFQGSRVVFFPPSLPPLTLSPRWASAVPCSQPTVSRLLVDVLALICTMDGAILWSACSGLSSQWMVKIVKERKHLMTILVEFPVFDL